MKAKGSSRSRACRPRTSVSLPALAAVLLALPSMARAQSEIAPSVAAGVAAANAGAGSASVDQGGGRDLVEWIDPATGYASSLTAQCGVVVEARLTSRARTNVLWLNVAAPSNRGGMVDTERVTARFASGRSRRLTPLQTEARVEPSTAVTEVFGFPDKGEFRGERSLTVDVPIVLDATRSEACILSVALQRHREADDVRTVDLSGVLAVEAGGGVRSTTGTAGLGRLGGGAQGTFDLRFELFPWVHHGLTFDIALDGYSGAAVQAVRPSEPNSSDLSVTGAGFYLGYAFQYVFGEVLSVTYALAPGAYVLELQGSGSSGAIESSAVLGIRQRLTVAGIVWTDPTGWFEVGGELSDQVIPFGSFGAVANVSGNSIAGLVHLALRAGM